MSTLEGTVDLHALHRLAPDRYPFLLKSTATTSALGRFDVLFAFPGDALVLHGPGELSGPFAEGNTEFLHALDGWWASERIAPLDTGLPFSGGWFLYLGYELAGEVEPGLALHRDSLLPTAFAVRCPAAIIRDHETGLCHWVTEADADLDIDQLHSDWQRCKTNGADDVPIPASNPTTTEEDPRAFLEAVERAKEYIAAGDIYQANLSRSWTATVDEGVDANLIFDSLCAANPGPFAGLMRWDDVSVISSSPERLLRVDNGVVSTRPIAGTRPRSSDRQTDDTLSEELFANPKERAEHVMLIDLERNDLGRVCKPGTVEVSEMMVLESYAHVHHIVSNVRGELRDDVTPGDTIRAVFPGGTITGCPKVRCMEIIDELEDGPRGAYTGSAGYLNRDGNLDLNILIRTMIMRDREVTLRAGSGIVADSEAEAELAETRAKAKGLIRALSP